MHTGTIVFEKFTLEIYLLQLKINSKVFMLIRHFPILSQNNPSYFMLLGKRQREKNSRSNVILSFEHKKCI